MHRELNGGILIFVAEISDDETKKKFKKVLTSKTTSGNIKKSPMTTINLLFEN
ncbi:hypothetical protein [Niallia sp. FSL W8-0954]|uniref:hypothetical protein n=1 Tax=Niallia sp. FSL W8-0954 TaxID=2975338 RepID=UPI0013DDE968